MIDRKTQDYELIYGCDWVEAMVLYSDPRGLRWRGTYDKDFLYLVGDVVAFESAPFVALLEDTRTDPGPDSEAFWSPLTPFNLTGYTVQIVCGAMGVWTGFTSTPEVEALKGKLAVNVSHSLFASAPSAAHWYLKITEPGGVVMEPPLSGTLLFRAP